MNKLKTDGEYTVDINKIKAADFVADFATEEETAKTIAEFFDEYGYVLDPHTAVAQCVYKKYKDKTSDKTPTVIISTASPYKFSDDVIQAIKGKKPNDSFEAAVMLEEISVTDIPDNIANLKEKQIRHPNVVKKSEIKDAIYKALKID